MKPHIKGLHHDHIDGSIAVGQVIEELYRAAGRPFPFSTGEAFVQFFQNPQEDIIKRFSIVTGVLQTTETLEMMGYAYGAHRGREGYHYVEGRFAPQYHTRGGLSLREATDALIRGLKRAGREFPVTLVPVVSIGRETTPEKGVEIAKMVLGYDGEVILDLACDEANHPPEKHLKAFELTFGTPVRRDCHAGEWVLQEPAETYEERLTKNIRTALFDLKCHGISHAITLVRHPELMAYAVDNQVRIAGCPLSNLQSGLIRDLRDLGIDKLLSEGVCYTLNSDDDLFLPPMSEVIQRCDEAYHFSKEACDALERNVFLGALATR